MVRYISDRVGVMYLGKMVEIASSDALYDNPIHPYTRALLSAIPVPDPDVQKQRKRIILEGDVPSPINKRQMCLRNRHMWQRRTYSWRNKGKTLCGLS